MCGRICSGKSYYARKLAERLNAVILSTDELTWDLTDNAQGEGYDAFAARANRYLLKKACEIARAGAVVILDWGFWTREKRRDTKAYCSAQGVRTEWHYVEPGTEMWLNNIRERNERVKKTGGPDFYVDDGLLRKLESLWETPGNDEIDVKIVPCRERAEAEKR